MVTRGETSGLRLDSKARITGRWVLVERGSALTNEYISVQFNDL